MIDVPTDIFFSQRGFRLIERKINIHVGHKYLNMYALTIIFNIPLYCTYTHHRSAISFNLYYIVNYTKIRASDHILLLIRSLNKLFGFFSPGFMCFLFFFRCFGLISFTYPSGSPCDYRLQQNGNASHKVRRLKCPQQHIKPDHEFNEIRIVASYYIVLLRSSSTFTNIVQI